MAANALEGHEIESIIVNDEICRFQPNAAWVVGGVKLLVKRADEEVALDLIGLVHAGDPPYVGSFMIVVIGDLAIIALLLLPWLLWQRRRFTPDT